ncbi:MAG: tetratricopeptide repeat protein [Salibacteraceae bacterium]
MNFNQETLNRIDELYKSGEYSKCILGLNEIITKNSAHADYFEQRAMCNYHLGKLTDCIPDFDQAQKLEPNNPYRYSSRAYVKGRLKDFDGATLDYETAIHLDPKDAVAHNNLGLILEQRGYQQRAKKNFEKADNLEGVSPKAKQVPTETFEEESSSVSKEIKKAITSKNGLKEFVSFILNGFKITK